MIPKPPTWISSRMTTWPKPLQYVAVSTVIRPVTQTALVAVNSAVTSGAPSSPARDTGSISSSVPTTTAVPKARTITWAGCRNNGLPGARIFTIKPPFWSGQSRATVTQRWPRSLRRPKCIRRSARVTTATGAHDGSRLRRPEG